MGRLAVVGLLAACKQSSSHLPGGPQGEGPVAIVQAPVSNLAQRGGDLEGRGVRIPQHESQRQAFQQTDNF